MSEEQIRKDVGDWIIENIINPFLEKHGIDAKVAEVKINFE